MRKYSSKYPDSSAYPIDEPVLSCPLPPLACLPPPPFPPSRIADRSRPCLGDGFAGSLGGRDIGHALLHVRPYVKDVEDRRRAFSYTTLLLFTAQSLHDSGKRAPEVDGSGNCPCRHRGTETDRPDCAATALRSQLVAYELEHFPRQTEMRRGLLYGTAENEDHAAGGGRGRR